MIRFGKPDSSRDFRTDRYFEVLFGSFYAMPEGNALKYDNLGRQIECLHIHPQKKPDLAVKRGIVMGLISSLINPIIGVLVGVGAAYTFADELRLVTAKFSDGRSLTIYVKDWQLHYLKKKSATIKD